MTREKLKQIWQNYQSSADAHQEVMSYERAKVEEVYANPPNSLRQGAVLILLYPKEESWHFALIERPEYNGVHSKQIALPGGKMDLEDRDLVFTAFREAEEEIGVRREDIYLLSALSEVYIPPSNFLVSPYVGLLDYTPKLVPEVREVANIIEVPLLPFVQEQTISKSIVDIGVHPYKIDVHGFHISTHFVWGATAMILNEFRKAMRE